MMNVMTDWLRSASRFGRKARSNDDPLSMQELAAFNAKMAGYQMARQLAAGMRDRVVAVRPDVAPPCKPSNQVDLESDWCLFWARELGIDFAYHRKLWELAYVLQNLDVRGLLQPGRKGVVFGCGRECIPAYCARRGVSVLATDIARSSNDARSWIDTGQHAVSLHDLHYSDICSFERLEALVSRRDVDMNAIPDDLVDFDFCWSVCALEHLGSIEKGLAFVENSLNVLKPKGVAIHTTEFAYLNSERTIDHGPTVLFLRRHFEGLRKRLEGLGHTVAPMEFSVGDGPMDKFIDGPPFPGGPRSNLLTPWPENYHLKVAYNGVPTTCYGLVVEKCK